MSSADTRDLELYAYTDHQRAVIAAVRNERTLKEAAETLGMFERNIYQMLTRLRNLRDSAEQGHDPAPLAVIPPGHRLKGQSTQGRDSEGRLTWWKTVEDAEARQQALDFYLEELSKKVKPRKPVKARKLASYDPDVMVGYPLGDHHWGMYSYAAETGADYDLEIAKAAFSDALDYLIDRSPPSETALFVNLGDALHINDRKNQTPKSGNILDVDSRYQKVVRTAAFAFNYAIEKLLRKHYRVTVVHLPGNHDPDAAHWLQIVTEAWFRNEDRADVIVSPAQFQYHQFGVNMLAMTHGDTVKLEELPGIMAAHEPTMWGDTKYRTAWTGHVHHSQKLAAKEFRAVKVESFGVLPPNDAYGASKGFAAQREMSAITLRRSGGELSRVTYNVDLSGESDRV